MSNNESHTEESAPELVQLVVSRAAPPTVSQAAPPTASETSPTGVPEAAHAATSRDRIAFNIPDEYPLNLPKHVETFIIELYEQLDRRETFPDKLATMESRLHDVLEEDKPLTVQESVEFRFVLMELRVAVLGVNQRLETLLRKLDGPDGILNAISDQSVRNLLDDTVEEFRQNVLLDCDIWNALWQKFSDKDHQVGTEVWEEFKSLHASLVREGIRKQEEYMLSKGTRATEE